MKKKKLNYLKIFEEFSNDYNEDAIIIDKLNDILAFLIYKSKKKNSNYINYTQLYIDNIILNQTEYHIKTKIKMSNKDIINAEYFKDNIFIKINNDIIYDIDNDIFTKDIFINKIADKYKKYLIQLNWKIKLK